MLPSIETTHHGIRTVVRVRGELDLAVLPRFQSSLRAAEQDGIGVPRVVVDLSEVDLMDSPSLGVLIGHRRRVLQMGGDLRLVAGPGVERVLTLAGVEHLFDVRASLDAAVADD